MIERRPPYPLAGFWQDRTPECLLHRAELLLLIITACVLLFVTGIWIRTAAAASPPVMATINVQAGDTLWDLAQEYGDPEQYILERVNALARANGMKRGQLLQEGQTLVIPVGNRNASLYHGGKYASRQAAN